MKDRFEDFWKGIDDAPRIERIEQWTNRCRDKVSDLSVSAFLRLAGFVSYGIRVGGRYRIGANVSAGLLFVSKFIGMFVMGRLYHRTRRSETRSSTMVSGRYN